MNWIEDLARRGIDTGCGGGNFCPNGAVNRAIMAQMLSRAWAYTMPFTSTPGNDTYTYTFNAANQLISVDTPSQTVSYTYDGDGLRFSKTTDAGTTFYMRDPQGRVLVEYTPTFINEYVYVDGQRICKIWTDASSNQGRVYYHADTLGTPLAETDDSGQLLFKAQYYPFGSEVRPGAATDPHKFTGKELDDKIGLYYFGARYYDAHLGRFISTDPVAGRSNDPQSWNRYAYGRDNPLRFIDPNGLDWLEYTGTAITWYGGDTGDRSNPLDRYPATSGDIGHQTVSDTGSKGEGPIPAGEYKIDLGPSPNRVASVNRETGKLYFDPEGGIQRVPWHVPAEQQGYEGNQPGWGTIRAYLRPAPGNNTEGRGPADRFYVHNSNKGYSHGCVETSTALFNRLLRYRASHPTQKSFDFVVRYAGQSTRGATQGASYPPLSN